MDENTRRRFEEKTSTPKGGCTEWVGCKDYKGYGRFWIDGRMEFAHRAAWIIYAGDIPKSMHVLHHCDNPGCVNLEHLFLGTMADNMKDKTQKNRQYHKITQKKAEEIFKAYTPGKPGRSEIQENSMADLARKYSVSISTIWAAINKAQNAQKLGGAS